MKKNILVVNDREDIIGLLTFSLETAGYNIIPAHSGEEALAILAREKIDLIILDRHMPGMDGKEVLSRIKSSNDYKNIEVIILTAAAFEHKDRIEYLNMGAALMVGLPTDIGTIIKDVETILGKSN